MRIASIVGLLVLGAASSACTLSTVTNPDGSISITGKSKTRFVSADKPVREQAYTGQAIEVINDGVNPGSGAGIVINGSPGATKVVLAVDNRGAASELDRLDVGQCDDATDRHPQKIERAKQDVGLGKSRERRLRKQLGKQRPH